MLFWCGLLFFLGVMAFVDSVFNMGELLIRTTTKSRAKKNEKLQDRLFNLEREVSKLQSDQKKLVDF